MVTVLGNDQEAGQLTIPDSALTLKRAPEEL
jgi:hypothetical protein